VLGDTKGVNLRPVVSRGTNGIPAKKAVEDYSSPRPQGTKCGQRVLGSCSVDAWVKKLNHASELCHRGALRVWSAAFSEGTLIKSIDIVEGLAKKGIINQRHHT
jgi:hypothetical protein